MYISPNFSNHNSTKKIWKFFPNFTHAISIFPQSFKKMLKKEILNLNTQKSSTKGSIPATILKQFVDMYLPFLTINKL